MSRARQCQSRLQCYSRYRRCTYIPISLLTGRVQGLFHFALTGSSRLEPFEPGPEISPQSEPTPLPRRADSSFPPGLSRAGSWTTLRANCVDENNCSRTSRKAKRKLENELERSAAGMRTGFSRASNQLNDLQLSYMLPFLDLYRYSRFK